MAIAVMNWIWQHSRAKNGTRLVLLAIADCCNSDDGTGAWPTIPELMAKTNLSERGVQLGLKEAESLGELKIERGAMGNNRHRFAVLMGGQAPQNLRPAESAPPQNLPHSPADSAPSPAESAPGTVSEPPENHQDSPPTGESPRVRARTREGATKSSPAKRGTRIPDDFAQTVTPEMVQWARTKCPLVDGKAVTEEFVDHWIAKPGKDGLKLDWTATWRNWLRREQKFREQNRPRGRASPTGEAARSTTDDRVAQAQALKRELHAAEPPPHYDYPPPLKVITGDVA